MATDNRGDRPGRDKSRRADFLAIILAGFASQAFFHLAGGRFDRGTLYQNITFVMQLLDPRLLADRLWESLWYMHIQPPLFNLFTGILLKLFPRGYAAGFEAIYMLIGLVLAWTLYRLMRLLGVSRWLALAVTILYQTGPADIFFRNWYFYSYPVMTLLVLAGYSLLRYVQLGTAARGLVFFSVLSTIALTRVVYHPVWFAAITAGIMIAAKNLRRRTALLAIGPALVIGLWLAKNYCLFGSWAMNTQLGWSLAKITSRFLTPEELHKLQAAGKISILAGIPANQRYEKYEGYMAGAEISGPPVAALSQREKSAVPGYAPRAQNNNYINYIPVNRQYARDAFAVMRYCPRAYLRGLAHSAVVFFIPTWVEELAGREPGIIPAYQRVWAFLGGNVLPVRDWPSDPLAPVALFLPHVCWFVVIFYVFVPVVFAYDWLRKRGFARWDRARLITLGFIGFNIAYVMAMGIFLDYGENNRFRSEIVPLTVVLAAVVLQRLLDGIRRSGPAASGTERSAPGSCRGGN
jgi:hypothetical protein